MTSLHDIQHNFLDYLLDNSKQSIIGEIVSTSGQSAEQRMMFYANAYRLRLKEALSSDYERLHSYLGDELFGELINRYIDLYPSTHPSLRYLGRHMVDLVSTEPAFSQWPELTEITRIEQAFNNSFDSTDSDSVTLQQLQAMDTEAWTKFSLTFHDSVQLLPQHYNSFQIWQALAEDQEPPAKTSDDSTWLIWRKELVSRYRSVQEPELAALKIALSGGSFVDICDVLMAFYSEQETPSYAVNFLQQWINDHMLSALVY